MMTEPRTKKPAHKSAFDELRDSAQDKYRPARLGPPVRLPRSTARVTYRKDRKGEWRWQLKAANFRIVSSGEGYKTFSGAERGYRAMVRAVMNARTVVIGE